MKKKILFLLLAVVLFIPISIVKASDITIDQIITRLNENITSGDSFLSKMGDNAVAEKFSSNIIRVYVSADPNDFFDNYEGNANNFRFFMEYRYEESVLSANNYTLFGVTDGNTVNTFDSSDIEELHALDEYINAAVKDMIYVAFNIKTNNSYAYIHNYLVEGGVESSDGYIYPSFANPPSGISTRNILDDETIQVNLDEINMLPNEGATNNNTNTNTNNKARYSYSVGENDYTISFTDDADRTHTLDVKSFMDAIKNAKEHGASEDELNVSESVKQTINELLKDEGELIDMYSIQIIYANTTIERIDGGFEFRIKITDEMKKYDSLKLVDIGNIENIADNPTKGDVVEMKKDGDYLVGTLQHLNMYALVGSNKTVENPKTGVVSYGTTGLIAIITLGGAYMLCKKKMSN
jgi:hypothetical protein